MTTKNRFVIAIIGILIFASLVFAAFYGFRKIPSIDEQLPPGSSAIEIRITHPDNRTIWPLNFAIPIQIALKGGEPVTSVDLYVNGSLYGTQHIEDESTNQQLLTLWEWQPGVPGNFILTARAMDASGNTGISNTVLIEAGPAIKTGSPVTIEEGQTWETIAKETSLSVDEIHQANPDLDPKLALAPGSQIIIPNEPDPVTNPNIIPAYDPLGEIQAVTETFPVSELKSTTPPKWNFIDDLVFLLKKTSYQNEIGKSTPPDDLSPQADPEQASPAPSPGEEGFISDVPDLLAHVNGCTVELSLFYLWKSGHEDGFFIYRSREGGDFERIVTLPPFDGNYEDDESWAFEDTDQYGVVSYYLSAFNVYGEKAGPPETFLLDQTQCTSGRFGLATDPKIDELGDLVLPINVDTAYLYLQINGSQAIRVPEGDRMFLPGSGVNFNLDLYLDNMEELRQYTDLNVHLEIWGWQAGELIYVGDLDRSVHRTVLSVCSVEGEGGCTDGGVGDWVYEMSILPDFLIPLNEQVYEIRWQTSSLSEADKICLAMATDFYGPGLTDSNPTLLKICYTSTVKEGIVGGNEGTFLLDFERYLYPEGKPKIPPYSGPADNFQDPDFAINYPQGDPFQLGVRVLSIMEEHGFNDISNTVYMHHLTQYGESDEPPLASNVPSLYDIEIIEDTYQPPTYEIRSKWACVIIKEDPTGKYSPEQEVCPLTYVECDVNMTCTDSGFLAMVGAGWDVIVDGYHDGKQFAADEISKTIPFCPGNDRCEDAVKKGVDYAVTYYTGIPATLPKSDEAAARGATMLIMSQLSSYSGFENIEEVCGDYCEDQIAAILKEHFSRDEVYKYGQPGCYDIADHYGYFPICFAPPTVVQASPGSGNFPGFVMVRVTRKVTPESINASEELKGKTQLNVTVDGFNDSRIGEYASFCRYQDNMTVNDLPYPQDPNSNGNRGYGAFGDSPLEEPLFETVQVEIPWLEPGQSIEIPVKLQQIHNQYNQGCIRTAHSQYLFYHGRSHMEATEYCYSEGSTESWVPCSDGSSDIWDFDNPAGP